MVLICISTTAPVNPAGTTPQLTHGDLWKALVSKARQPEEFVAVIESSRIISEKENGLLRGVQFKGEMGENGEVEEEITYIGEMKIDFHVPSTHQKVSNIISGLANDPNELQLTFTFEWPHPEIENGASEERRRLEEKYLGMSRGVVPHTVEVARRMKREGRL